MFSLAVNVRENRRCNKEWTTQQTQTTLGTKRKTKTHTHTHAHAHTHTHTHMHTLQKSKKMSIDEHATRLRTPS